jgi:NADP-dependent 3-hydroxy acid dehydrogenase YdfG/Flp pilus assembly protein TadD
MSSKNIAIAYCIDNKDLADAIDSQLSIVTGNLKHFSGGRSTSETSLADQLQSHSGPVLLLISDNFLKSAQCMDKSLRMLQQQGDQILPVVVDGYAKDENGGEPVKIPTNFDRVSDIIQYINYWQDQYLDLRKQKRHLEGLDEEKFNAHLKVMRSISSEAGEFLRLLRSMPYVSHSEFTANRFERFFRFINDLTAWENFKRHQPFSPPTEPVAEKAPAPEESDTPEVNVEEIPGIELLYPESENIATSAPPEEEMQEVPGPEMEIEPELESDSLQQETPEEMQPIEEPETAEDEFEEEEEEEEELAEETSEDELKVILETADSYLEGDNPGTGLDLLAQAIAKYPRNSDLHYHYALAIAQHTDNLPAASKELETVVEIEPDNQNAYFLLGEFAEIAQDYEKAREHYEKAIKLQPDYPDVYYRMGLILANQFSNKEKQAAKYFKKAIRRAPDNADALYQYAILLKDKLNKPQKAIKYLRRALEAQSDHLFANYDLAVLFHQAGQYEKARRFYLRAVAINPELKTPENEKAFAIPQPGNVFDDAIQAEHHTIEALKANISQLEDLLKTREQETKEVKKPRPRIDKTVFITGATSGIGKATAAIFAENGYRLILNGRREDRLEELRQHFADTYDVEVALLPFDVRDKTAVDRALEQLEGKWRDVDILINNAGKAKGLDPIHQGRIEHWDEMIDTNIKGLLYLTRAVAPGMVGRRNGHIINICSTAGKEVYPKGNVYCATKFAVDALTRAMRLDLFEYDIRVSQVSPAHVEETEFALVRFDGDQERARIYEDFKPLSSNDIAETIFYIATRPAHINIQDVVIMSTQQASATLVNRSGREAFEEEE